MIYSDLYNKVGRFLGYGGSPSGDNLTVCKEIVIEAYRRFLIGIDPRPNHKAHQWSFLRPVTTLDTVADTTTSALPAGFTGMQSDFIFDGTTYCGKITPLPLDTLLHERSVSQGFTGPPSHYAISPDAFAADTDPMAYSVQWLPTPDAAYTLTYSYDVTVADPSAAGDYIIGGDLYAPCLDAMCRQVAAETSKHGFIGFTTPIANELMIAAIDADLRISPAIVGQFGPKQPVYFNRVSSITYTT